MQGGRDGGRGDSCGALLTKAHVPFRPDKITNMPPTAARLKDDERRYEGNLETKLCKEIGQMFDMELAYL